MLIHYLPLGVFIKYLKLYRPYLTVSLTAVLFPIHYVLATYVNGKKSDASIWFYVPVSLISSSKFLYTLEPN